MHGATSTPSRGGLGFTKARSPSGTGGLGCTLTQATHERHGATPRRHAGHRRTGVDVDAVPWFHGFACPSQDRPGRAAIGTCCDRMDTVPSDNREEAQLKEDRMGLEDLSKKAEEGFEKAGENIEKAVETAKDKAAEVAEDVKDKATEVAEDLKDKFTK